MRLVHGWQRKDFDEHNAVPTEGKAFEEQFSLSRARIREGHRCWHVATVVRDSCK